MQGRAKARAKAAQRSAPKAGAPGWLAVGKSGERNTTSTPSRLARAAPAAPPCAAIVNIECRRRPRLARKKGNNPVVARRSGTCSPAAEARAARPSPATNKVSPFWRASRATAGSSPAGRSRATTPAPLGSRRMAARGSGRRARSLNSHSRGHARLPGAPKRLSAKVKRFSIDATLALRRIPCHLNLP